MNIGAEMKSNNGRLLKAVITILLNEYSLEEIYRLRNIDIANIAGVNIQVVDRYGGVVGFVEKWKKNVVWNIARETKRRKGGRTIDRKSIALIKTLSDDACFFYFVVKVGRLDFVRSMLVGFKINLPNGRFSLFCIDILKIMTEQYIKLGYGAVNIERLDFYLEAIDEKICEYNK